MAHREYGTKAPEGAYTYTVTAQDSGGEKHPVPVETRILIEGIDLKEAAVQSKNGPLALSDIHRIETKAEKPPAPVTVPMGAQSTAPAGKTEALK